MRAADRGLIVDPSAIADRTRRKASQSAASGAPAMIDAPAAIADRQGNKRTRKVRRNYAPRWWQPARDGARVPNRI
jgi:hypothetical protein